MQQNDSLADGAGADAVVHFGFKQPPPDPSIQLNSAGVPQTSACGHLQRGRTSARFRGAGYAGVCRCACKCSRACVRAYACVWGLVVV